MKYYVVSDIHGSYVNLEKVLHEFDKDGDYLLILGDILYHGPRNPLPSGHDPKRVVQLLNERKDKIIAVRGNCDGEVDQMVLDFPMTSDYQILPFEDYKIFMTHGHLYEEMNWLNEKDVYLFGHIHLPIAKREEHVMLNPGSISLPKEKNVPSYGVIEYDIFTIYDMNKNKLQSVNLK